MMFYRRLQSFTKLRVCLKMSLLLVGINYLHLTDEQILRRTYQETADRARGLAYYLKKHGFKRVGILCTNTPAFFESIYGIGAAAAVNVGEHSSMPSNYQQLQVLTEHSNQLSSQNGRYHLHFRSRGS